MPRNCRSSIRLLLALLAVGGFGVCSAASALASGGRVRIGVAARLPRGARVTRSLPTSTRLQLVIALRPRDPGGLQSLATAVSTPGSADFRHYLSVPQFARRFGATGDQIASVTSTLRSEGLTVGAPLANHLSVPVSGSATKVQQAFRTRLSQVRLASGRAAYANTVAPTVASDIAGEVQGVVGLNDLAVERPQGLARARPAALGRHAELIRGSSSGVQAQVGAAPDVATGGPQPCSTAQDAAEGLGGYTADTIASAYGFSSLYQGGDLGAGQTIALYELGPYNADDVAAYQSCYGTNTPVTEVDVDGGASGDVTEADLDIEQVIGLAPKANILVYEAPISGPGPLAEYAAIISQDQAKVISSSWGDCEAYVMDGGPGLINAEQDLFEEAALQGQSVYVASGDAGSAACSQEQPSNTLPSVQDPASQPFVTGVGGTTLYTTDPSPTPPLWTPGDVLDQGVWNDGLVPDPSDPSSLVGNASGGGISSYWAMPAYQSKAASSVGVINADSTSGPCAQTTYCREVPDVSADASPYTGYVVRVDGDWEVIAGTSAAAPLWAAFTGLVNDSPACGGRPVGFVNPGLYQIASYGYSANFSDVALASPITGAPNNDALGANGGQFPVTPGYDMTTGLGTPIAPTLATSMCEVFAVSFGKLANQSGTVGARLDIQTTASDSGGVPVAYGASGLPAGLALNGATGLISGTPTTAGTYGVTVSATDQFHNTGSVQFSLTIAGQPQFSKERFSGLQSGKPKLTFSVAAGSYAPALKSISVDLPRGVSFARKAKSLSRGISAKSSRTKLKFKLGVRHGLLTISFRHSEKTASVTIVRPSIGVSGALRSKVRRHKVKQVSVGLRGTDTDNRTTKFTVKLKI